MKKSIYSDFRFTDEYKEQLTELFRHNTNVDAGGYRLFDGTRTHMMQSPAELSELIFTLKRVEREKGKELSAFLEIGFSAGITNTVLNNFFNFDVIVAVDNFSAEINGNTLKANLMRKNLTLICGDSTSEQILKTVKSLGGYDFIFIDGNHNYDYVKKDFYNYKEFLHPGGIIALHDIHSSAHNEIARFWDELKADSKYETLDLICKDFPVQYGIGVVRLL